MLAIRPGLKQVYLSVNHAKMRELCRHCQSVMQIISSENKNQFALVTMTRLSENIDADAAAERPIDAQFVIQGRAW